MKHAWLKTIRFWSLIGMTVLGSAWRPALADPPPMPQTAAEIVEALSVPDAGDDFKRRGALGPQRGLAEIVDDPVEPSPGHPASNYAEHFAGLPKTAALIHFAFDSAVIPGESYVLLNEYAKALNGGLREAVLVIAGHTDDTGSADYNWALAQRRAQAVKDYLVARGVRADRLIVKSYAEFFPIAPNDSETGRSLNRRSEFLRVDVASTK